MRALSVIWHGIALTSMLMAGCAIERPLMGPSIASSLTVADQEATVVELERPVHFRSPDGAPVVIPSGFYLVTATDIDALQLTPHAGGPPLTIAAVHSPQTYPLEQTEPLAVAQIGLEEDTHYIVLAQADGTTLNAVGSYSGTQARSIADQLAFQQTAFQTSLRAKLYTSTMRKKKVDSSPDLAFRPSTLVTIMPGLNVTEFQPCTGMTGYVGSTLKMVSMAQGPGEHPIMAASENTKPRIILTQTYVAPPHTPQGSTTYPNTPLMRIIPNNPYRCMFGSVTVSGHLNAGQKVRLSMEVFDIAKRRTMQILDTYELPVTTGGSVTFGKVIVASIPLFNIQASQSQSGYMTEVIKKVAPNGTIVTIEASVDGGPVVKRDCLWKPTPNGWGQGTLTCK